MGSPAKASRCSYRITFLVISMPGANAIEANARDQAAEDPIRLA